MSSNLDTIMSTNPWETVDQAIDHLIDKVVLQMNPQMLDDQLSDTLDDPDERDNAIEYLIDKLQKIKEYR